MLEIKQVDKFFGHFQALKKINLKVEEGEFRGLIGPNGSGKLPSLMLFLASFRPPLGKLNF